jgi:SAM-dependent methyltransferase
MNYFKNYFFFISGINQGKSLCRIFQNLQIKNVILSGNIIEFGAEPNSSKNFSKFAKKKKINKLDFSDKHLNHKDIIKADLNKKINIKKNTYDTVLFFNVMEHLVEINNAKNQIHKILKKKGKLIGSTPFLYRYHGAPSDYYRFTSSFYKIFFKNKFKSLKVKNLGFGPCCLCYSILSDFTKKIPLLNILLFSISLLLDSFLSVLVKYELKDIFPIAIYFEAKK